MQSSAISMQSPCSSMMRRPHAIKCNQHAITLQLDDEAHAAVGDAGVIEVGLAVVWRREGSVPGGGKGLSVWFGLVSFRWVRLGSVWSGLVWSGLVWFGLVWFGLVWFSLVWSGLVWFGLVWFGLVLRTERRRPRGLRARATRLRKGFGLVWFGLVWFGLVWCGLVWFGLVWFGSELEQRTQLEHELHPIRCNPTAIT